MTWQEFMSYAHAGVEKRPLFGVADDPVTRPSRATIAAGDTGTQPATVSALRSLALSKRSALALKRIEDRLRRAPPLEPTSTDASRPKLSALPTQD